MCVRVCVVCACARASVCVCMLERGGDACVAPEREVSKGYILFSGEVGKCVCRWSCRGGVPEKAVPSPSRSERVEKPCSNAPSTPSASNVRDANMLKVTFHLAALFSFQIEKISSFFTFVEIL